MTDPVMTAARSLVTCMAAFRDLLDDDTYEHVALPALETLRLTLPERVDVCSEARG